MELGRMEKLSKLHPCMDVGTRICVVGGGPSGLSAAYAVVKLGYQNVTVLEKHHTLGGLCESVEIQGRVYDLGGQVVAANSAPTITSLAAEIEDVEFEDMKSHKLALIDCTTGEFEDLNVQTDYMSIISLTMKLQAKARESGNIGVHAVSDLASEPAPEYLAGHGMKSIPRSVSMGYTASGYGFAQDMPYAYLHEFARTSMLGKIRRVKGGYTSFWEKLGRSLPAEVCRNTGVIGIERDLNLVRVHTKNYETQQEKTMEFDKIVISGSIPVAGVSKIYRSSANPKGLKSNLLELSDVERELFCKVKTIDYYTTVAKIKGLDHLPVGFYYCKRYVEDPDTIGHPVAMQKFYGDTDIFLFWSYGNSTDIDKAAVRRFVLEDVKGMGAQVECVILQRQWTYFPHISAQDMKSGFYERLERELQGRQNTYYVGGLMAFELTELNSSYSIDLVCKHFASDSQNPPLPYVKRLFPLKTIESKNLPKIRELGEIPGVEFPDLATIDEYLRFWASNKIIGGRTLYSWVNEEGKITDTRTYEELNARTSLIAQRLLTLNKPVLKPGDRVLLIHPPGLDFVDAFFGCLRARVLAVPVLPPDPLQRGGQALAKVENVAKSCNALAILSTSSYHAAVRAAALRNMLLPDTYKGKAVPKWPDLPWFHTDGWTSKNSSGIKKPPSLWSWPKKREEGEAKEDTEVKESQSMLQHDMRPRPEEVCFLQFTSGSTGDAKGVIITNAGLVHNVKLMHTRYKSTSRTVLVSWLPQYHDMGLIGGLLTAMLSGGTAVLFSPLTFIRNPLLWLQTLSKHRATHSAGPNFAFELVVRRLETNSKKAGAHGVKPPYDLSSLVFLMASAEPVRQKTLRRFVELLGSCGVDEQVLAPGYGLAENSVFVTLAWGAGNPIYVDWQGRVCCGYVEKNDADFDVRIVDTESGEEAVEGAEGEIWVSSPSAGVGYWGRPEQSTETFQNKLEPGATRNYTRTGDLGRVVDGKLFVTGRIKDLIIVGGRNVYSFDVEKTVETCSEFIRPGCCAVVGVPEETLASKGISLPESSDQVGLVVIAEVREEEFAKPEVVEQIKAAVASEHGVEIAAVNLIKPKTICKTTSGKIRRFECAKQYTEGTLNVAGKPGKASLIRTFTGKASLKPILPPSMKRANSFGGHDSNLYSPASEKTADRVPNREDILQFLVALVSEKTGLSKSQISHDSSFVSYGLSSVVVVESAQRLSSFLGIQVAAIDIYTAGCISELTDLAVDLVKSSAPKNATASGSNPADLVGFLKELVAERTGVPVEEISTTENLVAYGIDSVGVVWAAQKLSAYLGVHVSAVDIFTASCITDLAVFAEGLLHREGRKTGSFTKEEHASQTQCITPQPSAFKRLAISILQLVGIMYAATLLVVPGYAACSIPLRVASAFSESPLNSLVLLLLASPAAWIFYMGLTALSLHVFGSSFLQLNYTVKPKVSVWSVDFVKWWTLYRARDFASTVLATHLRGTVFIAWWYRFLGADIGKDVILDSIDITDPSLVSIADEAVVSEGATLESHQVKNGMLVLGPIRIGTRASVGAFAFLQMGTILASDSALPALHRTEIGQYFGKISKSNRKGVDKEGNLVSFNTHIWHLVGIYTVAMISALSATTAYPLFSWLASSMQVPQVHTFSDRGFLMFSLAGAFHWPPIILAALVALNEPTHILQATSQILAQKKLFHLAFCIGCTYIAYGFVLSLITCILKWCIVGKLKPGSPVRLSSSLGLRIWLVHRLLTLTHQRFTHLLSGTEALCIYLKSLGAKIGNTASIRATNAIVDPDLLHLGSDTHLGDFSRLITATYNSPKTQSFTTGTIQIGRTCVTGTQSLLLPGSTLQDRVTLGAMSVAPTGCVLQAGGVYVGSDKPVMVNGQTDAPDDRIVEMDTHYRKIVGNLAAHLAKTTLKVQSRYFHRLGVAGRGTLTIFDRLPGIPAHDIFSPGKTYPVVVRHSNSLSADDDARTDARGASMRIMSHDSQAALVDLTLKTGKAFYARTIADFFEWLVSGVGHREKVRNFPHIRDAVWGSLTQTDSYTRLHYYSNVCRLMRPNETQTQTRNSSAGGDCYVKFKLRPEDPAIGEDAGAVDPGDRLLPPETGAIPRDPADTRPLLFLADDFRKKLLSSAGVRYVLQLQVRPVPASAAERDEALDCTKPWDENEHPYVDAGLLHLNEVVDSEEAENLRFDPYRRSPALDVVAAFSSRESASIDHGRSLVYEICQRLRAGLPLPQAWKNLLEKSDVDIDLQGCPVMQSAAAKPTQSNGATKPTPTRSRAVSLWLLLAQPLLQAGLPYALLAMAFVPSLALLARRAPGAPCAVAFALLPLAYVLTGATMGFFTVACKWALVGRMREGDGVPLWGREAMLDTLWQAVRTVAGDHFIQLCRGSVVFGLYMRSLGATVAWREGAYVDSMEALLNPEMVTMESNAAVGRNAMLFGHVYQGERVEYGRVTIGDGGCVGGRGVVMPRVCMEPRGNLPPLSLAMKSERIYSSF